MNAATHDDEADYTKMSLRRRWLADYPWIAFVLPLTVFLVVGTLEVSARSGSILGGLVDHDAYPLVYTAKIVLTTLALAFVWPAYRVFPIRIGPLAVGFGVIGAAFWIGLVHLDLERTLGLDWLTSQGERVAYNPLESLEHRGLLAYAFLAVRFFGLAVVIAVAEEMFLRGFLIRYVEDCDHWNRLPIGQAGWPALIAGTAVPMLMHPGEIFAAMVWFSWISWLMLRTRNLWDCIVAHMVTNLLLGIYVMCTGQWQFW